MTPSSLGLGDCQTLIFLIHVFFNELSPILGITAIGLGKMGYDAIQKDVQRMKDEGTYKDFLEEQAEFAEMVEGA